MLKSCLLLLPTGNATPKSFPSPSEVASPGVNPSRPSRQNPLASTSYTLTHAIFRSHQFCSIPPLAPKTHRKNVGCPKSSRLVLVVARCSTQLTFADFHTMKPFPQRSFIGEGMLRHTLVISIMSKKNGVSWNMTQKIKITTQPIVGPLKHQVVTIF